MIRTIWFYLRFALQLLTTIGTARQMKKLEEKGLLQEQQAYLDQVVKDWGQFLVRITGSKIIVKGKENIPDSACLIISNHQSNFDIPILAGYLDKRIGFIAKKELEKVPVISHWMRQIHCVFIDRENPRQAVRALADAAKTLQEGNSLVIFPEGTRSKGEQMNVFKKGSLRLADKSGVPVVPVTIDGSYKILEGNNNRIQSADVTVIVGEPIYMEQLSEEERAVLLDTIKAQIQTNLDQAQLSYQV